MLDNLTVYVTKWNIHRIHRQLYLTLPFRRQRRRHARDETEFSARNVCIYAIISPLSCTIFRFNDHEAWWPCMIQLELRQNTAKMAITEKNCMQIILESCEMSFNHLFFCIQHVTQFLHMIPWLNAFECIRLFLVWLTSPNRIQLFHFLGSNSLCNFVF